MLEMQESTVYKASLELHGKGAEINLFLNDQRENKIEPRNQPFEKLT